MYDKNKITKSIKTKVIFQITTVIAIVVTISFSYILYHTIADLKEKTDLNLQSKVEKLTNSLEERLEYLQETAELLATNKLLVNAFVEVNERSKYLLSLMNNFRTGKDLNSLSLVDFDGRIIFQSDANTQDFRNSQELQLSLNLAQTVSYFNKMKNEIVFILPVKYYDTTQGAIVVSYSLKHIIDRYNKNEKSVFTKIYIDTQEYYNVHYMHETNYYKYKVVTNRDHKILYNLDLVVEMGIEEELYLKPLYYQLYILLIVGFLILLIGALISYFIALSITNPILILYKRLNISPSQDIQTNYQPLGTKDELEVLGYAFYNKEKKLKESEKKLQTWIQNSPVCTKIVDLDFNLLFMSDTGIRDLNIENINEFYGQPYPFSFYPDSFKITMRDNLKKAKLNRETIEQEASVLDINGNELWFQSTIVPVNDDKGKLDYLLVVSLEISERKKAERLLRLKSEKLKEAQSLSMIGSWEYDIKEEILRCSDEQYKLYGFTDFSEKLTKDSLLKYYHPDDINIPDKDLHDSLSSKEILISHNRIFRKNDGELRYLEQRWRMVYENDIPIKAVGTTQDITELKQKSLLLVNQSNNAAIGRLMSMVAHQWRQPLSLINSITSNIYHTTNNKDVLKIEDITHELSKSISNIHKFYTNNQNIKGKNIKNLIEECIDILLPIALTKLRPNIIINEINNIVLTGFSSGLQQVIITLISNSIEIFEQRSILNPTITISLYNKDNLNYIEIADNGEGVDSLNINKIFDTNFSTSDASKYERGFGLSIAKDIIENNLKGKLTVQNTKNGAKFTIKYT